MTANWDHMCTHAHTQYSCPVSPQVLYSKIQKFRGGHAAWAPLSLASSAHPKQWIARSCWRCCSPRKGFIRPEQLTLVQCHTSYRCMWGLRYLSGDLHKRPRLEGNIYRYSQPFLVWTLSRGPQNHVSSLREKREVPATSATSFSVGRLHDSSLETLNGREETGRP